MYESIYSLIIANLDITPGEEAIALGKDLMASQMPSTKEITLSSAEEQLYEDLVKANQPMMKLVHEAQTTDLFVVAMRNYLAFDGRILPRDELIRIDVLKLAPEYVLNEQN